MALVGVPHVAVGLPWPVAPPTISWEPSTFASPKIPQSLRELGCACPCRGMTSEGWRGAAPVRSRFPGSVAEGQDGGIALDNPQDPEQPRGYNRDFQPHAPGR